MDIEESGEEGASAYVGVLDVVVLVSVVVVVGVILRRFWQKKQQEKDNLRNFMVVPNVGRPVQNSADGLGGSFLSKMKARNKKVVIFYGSQTGTAEEFAERLAKEATRHGLPAMTFDPEEVSDWDDLASLKEIEHSLAVFCVATYGEGDPTDNAQDLHSWLETGSTDLTGVNYTVFALGNHTYEKYNAMGRFVDKKLREMKATCVYDRGEGDDDGNIEEDFVTWKENLWSQVCQKFGIDSSQDSGITREYQLTVHEELPAEKVFTGEPHRLGTYKEQKPPFSSKNPYLAPVRVIQELHKGGDRSCMHVEMDITGSKLTYVTGDHVAIFPVNDPQLVERIGELLHADLDTVITLTNVDDQASKKHPFPCPTSYRTALSHYVDITSCPRTNVLRELAEHATEPEHRDFLLEITSATDEGKRRYSDWIIQARRSIVHVLEDLPSFKPPLDHLLELLPRLQARYYSISSSNKMFPSSVHITAVLVEYGTSTGRTNMGVATSWLKTLQKELEASDSKSVHIPIFIRHSSLRLPYHSSRPVIMVGPGTGLAPFRAFIQNRKHSKDAKKDIGSTVLFFGCRKKSEDYIYEEELEGYKSEGVLEGLHLAFSRDQEHKVYVQHRLQEQGQQVFQLLEKQGFFYVCGDARNMARDVLNTLVKIVEEHGAMSNDEAVNYVKKLQKCNRYLQDVWS